MELLSYFLFLLFKKMFKNISVLGINQRRKLLFRSFLSLCPTLGMRSGFPNFSVYAAALECPNRKCLASKRGEREKRSKETKKPRRSSFTCPGNHLSQWGLLQGLPISVPAPQTWKSVTGNQKTEHRETSSWLSTLAPISRIRNANTAGLGGAG